LPEAVRLIEKMHSDERETLIPYIKYPTYQSCLKALRLRAGISFPFTSHMARHTFGTMSLSAGIPIESIAKMMGHASISSTQIYAQVTDNKISEDMDRLIRKHQKEETKEEAV
ncbi:MAG: tyrosine-type recombinase/integrase, partial [Segatella oris]|uniref:tyrosine-type recombinase/integrase n=1 Tax=Segatella oris TaxID=28135 RepID=UPI003FA2527D